MKKSRVVVWSIKGGSPSFLRNRGAPKTSKKGSFNQHGELGELDASG